MIDTVLSITVLSAVILLVGAFYLWRKQGNSRQSMLMAILAFIMLANVAVWAIPQDEGAAPETGADASLQE